MDNPWLIMSSSCVAMPGMENFDTPKTQPVLFRITCPSMSIHVHEHLYSMVQLQCRSSEPVAPWIWRNVILTSA